MPSVCQLQFQLNWFDSEGNSRTLPMQVRSCNYKVYAEGMVTVPAGSVAGAEFDVVFHGLTEGAVCYLIKNDTGQELNRAWTGNWAPHMSNGGMAMEVMPVYPEAGAITVLRFMLTMNQVVDGFIKYWAFGT